MISGLENHDYIQQCINTNSQVRLGQVENSTEACPKEFSEYHLLFFNSLFHFPIHSSLKITITGEVFGCNATRILEPMRYAYVQILNVKMTYLRIIRGKYLIRVQSQRTNMENADAMTLPSLKLLFTTVFLLLCILSDIDLCSIALSLRFLFISYIIIDGYKSGQETVKPNESQIYVLYMLWYTIPILKIL